MNIKATLYLEVAKAPFAFALWNSHRPHIFVYTYTATQDTGDQPQKKQKRARHGRETETQNFLPSSVAALS